MWSSGFGVGCARIGGFCFLFARMVPLGDMFIPGVCYDSFPVGSMDCYYIVYCHWGTVVF